MSTSPQAANRVFANYAPPSDVYDEFLTGTQQPRPHLQPFLDALDGLGKEEFERRWEQALRAVHENGLVYSGNVTSPDHPRPWELDAIPLLISDTEWQSVSTALSQRAQVLNLALRDLYSEQTLLKRGVLPAELVFAHPGFLRSYHGQSFPRECVLHFYAADLVRAPDGRWWVVADRTEAPSGVGYALENRVVTSRMLPDVFEACRVKRLAPFFITVQETLRCLAPSHRENPRVVLLSHSPTSPNYFEDAYLARYLGYTLVEGGDLAVRDRQVMLKTLGGLLPVDVIFRRQNSRDCDPLDLGSLSGLGVAGLTQAVRAGNIGVANALGSGLVESSVFMAYMPQLCRALLGEDLLMPGVASWWCGQQEGLAYVLDHLDELVIQPAFRSRGKDRLIRDALAEMSSSQLAETIRSDPARYAARERVVRSSVPVWRSGLEPTRLAVRAYLTSHGDSYTVMQGALARTSSSQEPLEVSIRKGEGSKDTWILADGPVEHVTLLEESGRAIALRRSGAAIPSRAAENLFWLGRHLERADASARLIRSAVSRMTGETRSTSDIEVPVLLRCLADLGQIEPGYAVENMRRQLPAIERTLVRSVFDTSQPASLRAIVDELFRLGSVVRDRLSQDTWRIIHRIDEGFRPARRGTPDLSDLLELSNVLITELAAFSGIVMESMTRTQAFRFLEMGRRLERSLQVIGLLKNCLIPMPEVHVPIFETMLEVADSVMTYRSRYLSNIHLAAVLDLLLTDETNPRSLAYQFEQLNRQVDKLPRKKTQSGYTAAQRLAMSLLHSIRMLDIQAVAESHSWGDYQPLQRLAERWESQLPRLSQAISHRYLIHVVPAHQLADITPQ